MPRSRSIRKRAAVDYHEVDDQPADSDERAKFISQHPELDSDQDTDAHSHDHDREQGASRPKKSKGKPATKPNRRKGKLSRMTDLPLDIWFTVAEHLDPASLLSISRATKSLRNIFTSRRAKPLWSTVVAAAGLPELHPADDWTDMAMISLIYGPAECHVCGKSRASLVDYALRVRWCAKCRKDNLIRDIQLRRSIYLRGCIVPTSEHKNNRWGAKVYHDRREVATFKEKRLDLKAQIDNTETKEDARDAEHELEMYVAERKAYVAVAVELGLKLTHWSKLSQRDRVVAAAETKRARRDAIEKRLKDLGYTFDELSPINDSLHEFRSVVDQPTALTDSIWTRISPPIIAKCDRLRAEPLEREAARRATSRRHTLYHRYDKLFRSEPESSQETYPSFAVWTDLPSVAKFWKDDDKDDDSYGFVKDEEWDPAVEDVKREASAATRWIKLTYARAYIAARNEVGRPLAQDLVESINPPGYVPEPCTSLQVYQDDCEVVLDFELYDLEGFTGVDVLDPATISDAELDSVLALWTCCFVIPGMLIDPKPYPETYTLSRADERYTSPAARNSGQISKFWLKVQLSILESTGIRDGDPTETVDQLESLAPEFSCQKCSSYNREVVKPTNQGRDLDRWSRKISGLSYEDILAHVMGVHHWGWYSESAELSLGSIRYRQVAADDDDGHAKDEAEVEPRGNGDNPLLMSSNAVLETSRDVTPTLADMRDARDQMRKKKPTE